MAEISRATLFGKLNPLMFKAAEGAVTFCKLRGNPHVDLTHWLFQIVNLPDSDLHRILRHFEVDTARLVRHFQTMLERLPRGASAIEDFSEHLPYAVKEGWMYATLLFGESQVRSGYLLVGLLKNDRRRNVPTRIWGEFEKVKVETLTEDFARIVKGSPEDGQVASDGFAPGTPGEASNAIPPAAMGKQEALRRFASDLTARARAGGIDPVTGRDEEIRQVVDILMRRRRHRRRGEPPEARAGARHAPDHRCHHVGGVQEVHREGSGPHAPVPGGPGARADRVEGAADAAWRRLDTREAPPRPAPGRSARRGGQAIAPLHSRPAAPRQGGEPARYDVRPGGREPARHAARGRGLAPPDRGTPDRARHHRARGGDGIRGRLAPHRRRRAPRRRRA